MNLYRGTSVSIIHPKLESFHFSFFMNYYGGTNLTVNSIQKIWPKFSVQAGLFSSISDLFHIFPHFTSFSRIKTQACPHFTKKSINSRQYFIKTDRIHHQIIKSCFITAVSLFILHHLSTLAVEANESVIVAQHFFSIHYLVRFSFLFFSLFFFTLNKFDLSFIEFDWCCRMKEETLLKWKFFIEGNLKWKLSGWMRWWWWLENYAADTFAISLKTFFVKQVSSQEETLMPSGVNGFKLEWKKRELWSSRIQIKSKSEAVSNGTCCNDSIFGLGRNILRSQFRDSTKKKSDSNWIFRSVQDLLSFFLHTVEAKTSITFKLFAIQMLEVNALYV